MKILIVNQGNTFSVLSPFSCRHPFSYRRITFVTAVGMKQHKIAIICHWCCEIFTQITERWIDEYDASMNALPAVSFQLAR